MKSLEFVLKCSAKAVLCCCAFMLCSVETQAAAVSPSSAKRTAKAFMEQRGLKLRSEAMRAPVHGQSIGSEEEYSPYYVFNAARGKGFVIISGDDKTTPVLGYSTEGSFDSKSMPDNMQWWLDNMAQQIEFISKASTSSALKRASSTPRDNITPLVTALWDQGAPYNNLCPQVNGHNSITGCAATALAQVLYYHKWPKTQLKGALAAYYSPSGGANITVPELEPISFDWDNMLDSYNNSATEAQKTAVAQLMRYCGQLHLMNYSPSYSGAYYVDIDRLVRLFDYDQGAQYASFEHYTVDGWEELLYNELANNRPICYSGYSTGGGHAFVLDGYRYDDTEGRGYFHVNWGWNGSSNGYYLINLLQPGGTGSGASTTSDGYNNKQMAIVGLCPAKTDTVNYGRYLMGDSWSREYEKWYEVFNHSIESVSYMIAWAERDDYGNIETDESKLQCVDTIIVSGLDNYVPQNWHGYISIPEDNRWPYTGLWKMVPVCKEAETNAPWRPLFGPQCVLRVYVEQDNVSTLKYPTCDLRSGSDLISISGSMMAGLKHTVNVFVENYDSYEGYDDFLGSLYGYVYKRNDNILGSLVCGSETCAMIPKAGGDSIWFYIAPSEAGNYTFVVAEQQFSLNTDAAVVTFDSLQNAPGYLAHKNFSVGPLLFTCESVEATHDPDKGNPAIACTLNNGTNMDYNAAVLIDIYKKNGDQYELINLSPIGGLTYGFITINSGDAGTVYIKIASELTEGTYRVDVRIASDFVSLTVSDYFVFHSAELVVGSTTNAEALPQSADTEDAIYDLLGRETQAGEGRIVIQGGRKEIRVKN